METMYPGIAFSPQTRLTQPVSEDDTIINVESTAVFPSGSGYATLGTDESAETVWYAQKTETVLSGCKRGVEGIPRQWQIGEPIARYFTNEDYKTLCGGISELDVRASALEASTEDHAAKLKTLDGQVIHTYTHTLTGTVHKLTGTGEIVQFQATADFHDGDTFTVNGKPAESVDLTGSPLSASYYLRDSWVLAAFYGGKLHFQGHNLTAKRNLLINSSLSVWQKGTQFTFDHVSGGESADGWYTFDKAKDGKYTIEQSTDVPDGLLLQHSMKVNFISLPSGDFGLRQETGYNVGDESVYFTLSFWVKGPAGQELISTISDANIHTVLTGNWQHVVLTRERNRRNNIFAELLRTPKQTGAYYFAAPKLEIGTYFTGFSTPDPILEFQRVVGRVVQAPRKNILINEDFKINQRGQTTYTGAGYTVDGWKGVGNPSTLVADNGVKLSAAVMYHGIIQLIENYQQLRGKDVVVSIEILAHSGGECYVEVSDGVEAIFLFFSQPGIYSKAFKVSNNATKLEVGIRSRSTTEINTLVHRIKLEEGQCFTGFTVPEPALERARCQRYLIKIARYKSFRATIVYPDYLTFTIPCGTMRVDPRIVGSLVIKNLTGTSFSGFTFSVHTNDGIGTQIRATKNAHGLSDAILMCDSDIFLDANM